MAHTNGKHTFTEIHSQPAVWQAALAAAHENRQVLENLNLAHFDQVVFTGCGSTYYLSLSAAVTLQRASGALCKAVPASSCFFTGFRAETWWANLVGCNQPLWLYQ